MQLTKRVLTVGKLLKKTEDSRYLFSKLKIDPEKGYAEATNGKWLVRVPLDSGNTDQSMPEGFLPVKDSIFLTFEQTADLLKKIPKNPINPALSVQRSTAYHVNTENIGITFSADSNGNSTSMEMEKVEDRQWPETEKVFPKGESVKTTVSADLLLDLIKNCKGTQKRTPNMVRIEIYPTDEKFQKPVKFSFSGDNEKETMAILMPVYLNGK